MSIFLIFTILSILPLSIAEDRPHGFAYEYQISPFSPQAYEFFHPRTSSAPPPKPNQCHSSNCETMPLAATVRSTPAQESVSGSGHWRLSVGSMAAISISFVLMCIVGIGVYYVTIKRRANMCRASAANQPPDA